MSVQLAQAGCLDHMVQEVSVWEDTLQSSGGVWGLQQGRHLQSIHRQGNAPSWAGQLPPPASALGDTRFWLGVGTARDVGYLLCGPAGTDLFPLMCQEVGLF